MNIPNFFGKNDRFIVILPFIFWLCYTWASNFSLLGIFFSLIGTVSIIFQVYRDEIENLINKGKIKTTRDYGEFIRKDPCLLFCGVIIIIYYLYTLFGGIGLIIDNTTYALWIMNVIGAVYIIFTIMLRKEIREKVCQVAFLK